MKMSETVKPISYLKAHTAEIIRDISDGRKTYVITQNGEAKAVFQDVGCYEQTQETLALLKMVAQSAKSLHEGRVKPLRKALKDLRTRIKDVQ
jgi:prevent-host-death family protein